MAMAQILLKVATDLSVSKSEMLFRSMQCSKSGVSQGSVTLGHYDLTFLSMIF